MGTLKPEQTPPHTETKITPELLATLEQISGTQIETDLINLTKIGGKEITPSKELAQRYSVNRLALSKEDAQARIHLRNKMEATGMTVEEHPLGLIGTYLGTNPDLPAIGMLSHFDSVPDAGMYDGTVGVMSAIHIVQKLKEQAIKPKKSIKVIAVTGEESARFNMALFGSKGMFQGLTNKELDLTDKQGITMRQALINRGYDPETTKQPLFKKKDFEEIIEFHVAQDNRHPNKLSIIEAIAAPERYQLKIGNNKLEPIKHKPTDIFLNLSILGATGHSGVIPMGAEHRNDGLVITSKIVQEIIKINELLRTSKSENQILVGNCNIASEAMNKIPGRVDLPICITGLNPKKIKTLLKEYLFKKQSELETKHQRGVLIIGDSENQSTNQTEPFYSPKQIRNRQKKASIVIQAVHEVANIHTDNKCVGTVSTYNTKKDNIELGIDFRGIDLSTRQKMIAQIKKVIRANTNLKLGEPLPGSGKPEFMDTKLVILAQQVIKKLNIAPQITTFSPAGHDIQNVSRAGIKTALIFCPSPNGLSHNPNEYSSPEHLEWGTKAMAAFLSTF